MALSSENKKEIIKKITGKEEMTGSSEAQIGIFTERISYMTEHLNKNKKDHSARRGLIQLVSKRKRLLSYLRKNDLELYKKVMKEFNIRESKG